VSPLGQCSECGAILAPWERGRCSCRGPRDLTHREVLYAIACQAASPLHARDFIRNAVRDYRIYMNQATAIAVLSSDPRFCWSGRGTYALYRHGQLPGPRNLEEAARIVLLAGSAPMSDEALDFCLKQLGYRYNVLSLRNACAWSEHVIRQRGRWDHPRGLEAELGVRRSIRSVPPPSLMADGTVRDTWPTLLANVAEQIRAVMADRERRLTVLSDPRRFGIEWETAEERMTAE
jgi:hypothetical protein